MQLPVQCTVNAEPCELSVRAHATLLDVLRDQLGLTGTHEGCRMGDCGACTVLLDGLPVNACLILAPDMEARSVTTIEGLSRDGRMSALQDSFVKYGAVQCGYCTPGMIMAASAWLNSQQGEASSQDLRCALSGNLCRCTGYAKIVQAVMALAQSEHE